MTNPVIKFKKLKNHYFEINETAFNNPMSIVEKPTHLGPALVPSFDMEHVFEIELLDEKVKVPVRKEKMSERLHNQRVDDAYKAADEARTANNLTRKQIKRYVDAGVIEVVSDPFATEIEAEEYVIDGAEPGSSSAPKAPKKTTARKPAVKKKAAKKPAKKKVAPRKPKASASSTPSPES